jgi:uncharacterized protein (DUF1015 family)
MKGWLRPAQARLVSPEYAWRVVSPDFDALTPYERYRWASENPDSFFNAFTPSMSWPNRSFQHLVDQAAAYLEHQLRKGSFGPLLEGLFVYRITDDGHQQTGVVGDAPVASSPDRLVPHETTRTEREEELFNYMGEVPYSSNPMGLGYPPRASIKEMVKEICLQTPDVSLTMDNGALHQIWVVPHEVVPRLVREFAAVPRAYIVDGHHRAAASLRHAARWQADDRHPAGRMLVIAFPNDELRIHAYHRWVAATVPAERLERRLGAVRTELRPPEEGEVVAVTAQGCWAVRLGRRAGEMDATALNRTVLRPLLGVEDERNDPRMDFIPDQEGLKEVVDRVAQQGGVGFMLAPASIEQVMHAADNRLPFPPKATFFVPKPRSGFFLSPRHGDRDRF